MGIILPDLIEERLQADKNLRSAVDGTVSDFNAWLDDSKLPFFTDYTDHGTKHLTQVLATAVGLMTNEARQLFTCSDAAVLVIATLLHDCALHLSEAGFWELIKGKSAEWRVPEFDRTCWPELWEDFLFLAKRWDDRKLIEVLGETKDGGPRAGVHDPFEHFYNLTESDRKLIGEFIRANHPRLAHEFARFGVPGPKVETIKVDKRLNAELTDIAGLIARSHGLPVRRCVDYLATKYHRREFQGVHAVYLMTLLRVADNIQIQADRANPIAFQYRHISSPRSLQEWKAHDAVSNITQTHDDPESLEIQAKPNDVRSFLRLREWLAGIQIEFDASWAVLGEIYGSHKELRHLGLILRRVRSNLDDVEAFARTVEYVPRRIEFDVARAQLLKLLIRPLYGDQPSIGIRELVQNAVDAVRERWFMQERHPELRAAPLAVQEADVIVWLDDPDESGFAWLTISDRGVGMTEEVVRDYFLKAGASFRYSDAWRKEFEARDGDSESQIKSRVLRSGRFGVGALAAFLLGDEIFVTTRHLAATKGISFTTRLDADPVEIRYDSNIKIGTSIRIRVSRKVQQALRKQSTTVSTPGEFDWYCFDKPDVLRLLGKTRSLLQKRYYVRLPDGQAPVFWRKIDGLKDYDIYWSYSDAPPLSCNGLFVSKSITLQRFNSISGQDWYYRAGYPNICVLDPDGNFPLNLQRNLLSTRSYPFERQLLEAIIFDFFAQVLVHSPEYATLTKWKETESRLAARGMNNIHFYKGHRNQGHYYGKTMFTRNGISIFEPSIIKRLGIRNAAYMFSASICSAENQKHDSVLMPGFAAGAAFIAQLLDGLSDASTGFAKNKVGGLRVLVRKDTADSILHFETSANSDDRVFSEHRDEVFRLSRLKVSVVAEWEQHGWTLLSTPDCPKSLLQLESLDKTQAPDIGVVEVFFSEPLACQKESGLMGDLWNQVFSQPFIPFDLKMRREQLAGAYEKLRYFVEFHEALGRRAQR